MALIYDDATVEFRDTEAPRTPRRTTTRTTTRRTTGTSSSSPDNNSSGGDGCFSGCLDQIVSVMVFIFKAFLWLLAFGFLIAMCS